MFCYLSNRVGFINIFQIVAIRCYQEIKEWEKTRGKFPFGFIRPARANTEADNNLKANTHLWRMKDFGSERLLSFISNFRLIDAERGLIEYGLLLRLGSISKTRKE